MDEPPSFQLLTIFSDQSLLYFLITAVFLILSAWASSVESAFFSLHPDEVERFRTSNDARENVVANLVSQPRLLLNAIATWKYIFLIAAAVFTITQHTFILEVDALNEVSFITLILILTVVFALMGVIVPKIYGARYAVSISKNNGKMCEGMVRMFKPLLKPLLQTSERVEKKLEGKKDEKSEEELSQALQLAIVDNEPIEGEEEILKGIVNFGTLRVHQVMRQRHDISFAEVTFDFHELLEFVNRSGYSRVPVCRNTLDNVEGFLYIKDLLPFLRETKAFPWQRLLRPAYLVNDTQKIDFLLKDFQEKRVHMAVVVHHHSRQTVGLITLEDIIEEIIGDINDEFDEVGVRHQKIDADTFLFDGKVSIQEFCQVVHVDPMLFKPVKGLNETLSGMLMEVNEKLPAVGDEVIIDPFTFRIEATDRKRIKRVSVTKVKEER